MFIRHIIFANKEEQHAAAGQSDDLDDESCLYGNKSQHTTDEISGSAGYILDGDLSGQALCTLCWVRSDVDDVVGQGDESTAGEDTRKHSSGDDSQFGGSHAEEPLPHGVAYRADKNDSFYRKIRAELAPEWGEGKVHDHHGSQSHAEHGTIQIALYNKGWRDRMYKVRRQIKQHDDAEIKEKAFLLFDWNNPLIGNTTKV